MSKVRAEKCYYQNESVHSSAEASVSAQGVFWDRGVYFISQPRGKAVNHNINMGEHFEAKEATHFLSDFFLIIGSIQYSLMILSVYFFFT